MPPLRPFLSLVLALLGNLSPLDAAVPVDADATRTHLAQLLAFGRAAPTAASSPDSLGTQLDRHRAALATDPVARERTARAAWRDAFGREPSAAELSTDAALPLTYTERVQRHLERLHAAPTEYREVIQRAYRLVVHRDAYAEESEYWRPHGTLTFVVLVACVEDWARRNRPGLMVTAGVPAVSARSRFVTILPLSPALANEARTALALDRPAPVPRIVTPGALNVASTGGMHVALVGRD